MTLAVVRWPTAGYGAETTVVIESRPETDSTGPSTAVAMTWIRGT
jgi:hypothetical protein